MTPKRRRRAHRRRALQSALDARKRTGRKLIDLRNPASRWPEALRRRAQGMPIYPLGPEEERAYADARATAAIDELLR